MDRPDCQRLDWGRAIVMPLCRPSCALPLIAVCFAIPAAAAGGCRDQLLSAESRFGVPQGLLSAIGAVESGMDPLAVNADGIAYHPGSAPDAVRLVRQLRQNGSRFIDVGCLQIDLFYHPHAFSTLAEAFDPAKNAAYGASVLVGHHVTYGDWTSAVAYYHSSDPARQAQYLRRVGSRYRSIDRNLGTVGASHRLRRPATSGSQAPLVMVKLSFMTITRPVESAHSYHGGW